MTEHSIEVSDLERWSIGATKAAVGVVLFLVSFLVSLDNVVHFGDSVLRPPFRFPVVLLGIAFVWGVAVVLFRWVAGSATLRATVSRSACVIVAIPCYVFAIYLFAFGLPFY